jgi:surface carbohydrate biosynthesis protein
MGKKVAFVVSNYLRDISGIVLTALYLSQKGVKCILVPFPVHQEEIFKLCPDLVVHSRYEPGLKNYFQNLKTAGISYGFLDTDYYINTKRKYKDVKKEEFEGMSFYCLWGEFSKEEINNTGIIDEKKIFITGNPSFDLNAEIWREIFTKRIEKSVCKYGIKLPYILFCTSFGLVNRARIHTDKVIADTSELHGISKDIFLDFQKKQWDDLIEMVELIKSVSTKYPHLSIVIRPHPGEDIKTYHSLLSEKKNVVVIKDLEVGTWLNSALMVIQSISTTALEASIRGILAIKPDWFDNYNFDRQIPHINDFVIKTTSKDETLKLIDDIYSNNNILTEDFSKKAIYINAINDGYSHKKVGDIILDTIENKSNSNKQIIKQSRIIAYGLQSCIISKEKIHKSFLYYFHLPVGWSMTKWRNVSAKDILNNWDLSVKFFNEEYVNEFFSSLKNQFEKNYSINLNKVKIVNSSKNNDYHFGYIDGRSVTIENS